MDAFVSRKRRRADEPVAVTTVANPNLQAALDVEEESTDFKLALLASLHPEINEEGLLETLLASDGSAERASETLSRGTTVSPRKRQALGPGYQSSLSTYRIAVPDSAGPAKRKLTKKGTTLHLYSTLR